MVKHIIIGGGISGLKIASEIDDYLILERGSTLGGRIKTIKKENQVLYEAGPWRVHESHKRVLNHLNFSEEEKEKNKILFDPPTSESTDEMSGMTLFDTLVFKNGLQYAIQKELNSGYYGNLDTMGGNYRHKTGAYYKVPGGFASLVDILKNKCNKKSIKFNHRVINVLKKNNVYHIHCKIRQGNEFINKVYECNVLFICCPPKNTRSWDICKKYLKAQLNLVKTYPLNHIYAKGKPLPTKHIVTNNELSQIIPGNHNQEWFQASYTGGKLARFWANLRYNHPLHFKDKLIELLKKELGNDFVISHYDMHYWQNGVHMWIPAFQAEIDNWVERCLVPHPKHLPNVYWAGEAFSSFQGWVEGALETSEKVLELYKTIQTTYKPITFDKTKHLILDGRILNPEKWKEVHPGTKSAIEAHLGEDISVLFRQIGHSGQAWAHAFSIQEGFI